MEHMVNLLCTIASKVLDVFTSAFVNEKNQKSVLKYSGIAFAVLIVACGIVSLHYHCHKMQMEKDNETTFMHTCRSYIENEDYDKAVQLLQTHTINDAETNMIYAYLLANGYGVEKDINKSIHYYSIAKDLGNAKAETNMVVSVVKNCATAEKVDVLRDAYENGNQMAEEYLTYVISSYNAKQSPDARPLTTDTVWDLPEDQLLEIINGPFYYWIGSNVTYNTSMSTSSTPTFTRKYLYSIGSKRVYEEMHLIADPNFPEWFQEDLW